MSKGQSPKDQGSVCNIPISEIDSNCSSLPRPVHNNGDIMKLKRKVEYSGYVHSGTVRPRIIESFKTFWKLYNHLPRNIETDLETLPGELLNLQKNYFLEENIQNYIIRSITQLIDNIIENSVTEEEHDQYNTSASNNTSGERNDWITQ